MNGGWLAIALAAVVLGIAGYAALLALRERQLERKINDLESNPDNRV